MPDDASGALRRLLLYLLLFGLIGSTTELLLLKHYEKGWMLVPFAIIALALVAAAWRLIRPGAASVAWLRRAMVPLVAGGAIGVILHYRGGLEFQADMDPTLPHWQLFWKVIRMQAPPALAPGILVQLGLLGLAATYRDPLTDDRSSAVHLPRPQ